MEDLLELPLPLPMMQIITGKMSCYFFYPLEINSLTTIAHFNLFTQKPQKVNEGLDYQELEVMHQVHLFQSFTLELKQCQQEHP